MTSTSVPQDPVAPKIESTVNSVPMWFPAILRNSKLADRFAYLREGSVAQNAGGQSPLYSRKRSRDDREGKRWVRRRENARFTDNPHIAQATYQDIQIHPPSVRRTFPEPLPSFLPRNVSVPTAPRPVVDVNSANMGRYSMSLKGMRRTLRGHGPRAEMLVRDIETEMLDWLVGGTILLPDEAEDVLLIHGRPIGNTLTVSELSRTPLQLVWNIEQDGFARYIAHCCARYHKIVSYSKDIEGRRLTYLLRPNVTRPDFAARHALDTPPATTDSDYSLGVLSESDILSVEDEPLTDSSDVDMPLRNIRHRRLSAVSEKDSEPGADADADSTPRPLRVRQAAYLDDMNEDADDDKSIVNVDLAQSVDSLDIDPTREPPVRYSSQLAERTPLRDRRGVSRASSSPSRSPCPASRRKLRNGRNRMARRTLHDSKTSFFDYLYS